MKRVFHAVVLCAALAACKTATTEKPAAPAAGNAATQPSDEEMKKVYQDAKERLPEGSTFETFKSQIAEFLARQKRQEALQKKIDELKAQHQVTVALAPPAIPRVEVSASGPARGPQNARITIVEFSDFQCPYCGREIPIIERVMKEYDGKVRLVFRPFPLDFHQFAQKAAEAGACAADQGGEKFWKLHDRMFTNQQKLAVDDLKGYAKEVGLDSGRFDKCLDAGEKRAVVEADGKAGQEAGVTGTPAFFINGVFINGAVPYEQFKDAVDRELNRKG